MIDAQIGHEKTLTTILPSLTGSNFLYGMGMIDMGMALSYDQLVIDAEIVRMVRRTMQGIAVNDATIALEVIKSVGAGGNYLIEEHTVEHMRRESSRAKLIDRNMRAKWKEKGSKNMQQRAREESLRILENYNPIPLSNEASTKIREIITNAEKEFAANNS